jgi:hypothetical protein
MRRKLIYLGIVVLLALGIFLYTSTHTANSLQVAPAAAEEIQKAKER